MTDPDPRNQIPDESPTDAAGDATPNTGERLFSKRAAFYMIAALVALLVFTISVMDPLAAVLKRFFSLLSPVFIGCVIAYLCNPILEFYEYRVFHRMKRGGLKRGLSLFTAILTALSIVLLILLMILPQLYHSVMDLVENYPVYLNNLDTWLRSIAAKLPVNMDVDQIMEFLYGLVSSSEDSMSGILDWINVMIGGDLGAKLWHFLSVFITSFMDAFVGIFIAFYILASKEKRVAQIRKFRYAFFDKHHNDQLQEFFTLTDNTFGGFIFGKILDSMVVSILTFVLLSIFDISEYNILIAAFMGITNIIPIFGPFIGAIPSFVIVLISSPSKAFLFLLLVLIIQQLDSNIIAPKILGDNTGVSSLCVVIAIALCGSLWGVSGILLGVPVFAVIIEVIRRYLEHRLENRGKPTDTTAYYPADAVGDAETDVHYEHATLLYRYRQSRIKPVVDRIRSAILRPTGSQKPAKSDQDTKPPSDGSTPPPADP